jgi:hypothetical protein
LKTAAIAATFACALVLADRRLEPERGAVPATAGSSVFAEPLPSPVAPTQAAIPATKHSGPSSRSFAWAPVPGASGYHVELFRRNSLVLAADTPRAGMTIPAKWSFDRREFRWASVAYRWYVWPIVSGKRTTSAVVQARFVVRDR